MPRAYNRGSVEERFWRRVDKSGPNGCWVWQGFHWPKGYGGMNIGGNRMEYVHRVSYRLNVGSIPEDLEIDHLCRNRGCVNPEHLELVTTRENLMRGETRTAARAAQTHCIRGHEFTPENTAIHSRYGTRKCRACDALYRREKRRMA